MKKTFVVSSLLLAPTLIVAQEVQAEEHSENPEASLGAYNSALEAAKNEGIILVQEDPQTVSTESDQNQAYQQQTKELQEATQQYTFEKDQYARDLASYEAA
ncbi:hypothetical protein E5983_08625, partial [Streptococcus danieliae]